MDNCTTKPLQDVAIARVSTVPFFVFTQLNDQLEALQKAGATISVIASDKKQHEEFNLASKVEFIPIYIAREINLLKDLWALYKLWKIFRLRQFQIVHSTTPKAGLLCAIAAKLARVPVRLHTFTGQPWVYLTGLKKTILKACDKIIIKINVCCYTDSFSQRNFLSKNKIFSKNKIAVVGNGSLAGVNIERFTPPEVEEKQKIKQKVLEGVEGDPLVILFVGRITRDKGISELIEAFNRLKKVHQVILLLVGPVEADMEEDLRHRRADNEMDKIICTGYTSMPEHYMAIADILAIPSYREGFGTVVIEAAAMGLPAVGSDIYGLQDAIVNGETGILVEPKNSFLLAQALEKLLVDEKLRIQMGSNAKNLAIRNFDSKNINALLIQEYKKHLLNVSQ